jgi:hypothetical protein
MNTEQQLFDELSVRRFEYDDTVVLAADVDVGNNTSVDIVDNTVILVDGDEQYEQPLPDCDTRAFINNGILTIELSAEEDY